MKNSRVFSVIASSLVAVIVISVSQTATAQNAKTENWLGTLDVTVAKLRLQLELKVDKDGNYSGTMISLDQGATGIKMDAVVRTDDKLEFEIKAARVRFAGTLNKDQTLATGKFTQGQDFDIQFKRVDDVKPDKHIQSWKGTLVAGKQKFEFQFRVFEDSDGNHFAKLDSFTEKLPGIQCEIQVEDDEVTLTIPATAAKFVGTLSEDKKTIDGHWLQGGGKFPLKLDKIPLEQTRRLDLKRPQTPKPPFDYLASDFVVHAKDFDQSANEDINLAGTITTPKGEGPFPTVILISGSGPQDRDETIFEHKPFFVIADHLTKRGFAVIRFDERGVAKSTGDFANATSADLAQDVEAIVSWAKNQPKVDAGKIVLAGHSEGGLIAPMIASRNKDVAGVIMLAGPGVSGAKIILNQTRKIAATAGADEKTLDAQEKMLRKLLGRIDSGQPLDEAFKKSLESDFSDLVSDEGAGLGAEDAVEMAIAKMESPWMRFFVIHDPQESLTATKCPILSVIGEKDLQVDPELNMPAIESAVKAGGNRDFVQKQLPGLNHLFQSCETGSPAEYVRIEQTLDVSLLDEITQWLEKRFK